MKVVVTGSSGLIGSALVDALEAAGHRVTRLVRSEPREGEVAWDLAAATVDAQGIEGHDAVVHLAGESIAGRWTPSRKARIVDSRLRGTLLLSHTLARLKHPPAVLVSASAVGFYGDRGDEALSEESAGGKGFLPEVCRAWESAAQPARTRGIRVVHPRFGVVLSRRGGALARMLPLFRFGLGGPVGSGRQFLSWIALDDAVRAVEHTLAQPGLTGPANVVAPQPATNAEFARALGHVLRRPAFLRVPAWVIRLMLGEMGRELLLASTRALPARLAASGFVFRYPKLADALRHAARDTGG